MRDLVRKKKTRQWWCVDKTTEEDSRAERTRENLWYEIEMKEERKNSHPFMEGSLAQKYFFMTVQKQHL